MAEENSITTADVVQYYQSKSDDVIAVDEARTQLAKKHGVTEDEVTGVLFKATEAEKLDGGEAGFRLRDDLDVSEAAESGSGGTAPGMQAEESVAEVEETDSDVEGDTLGNWEADSNEKIEIGKIDQETGKPIDGSYEWHIPTRADTGHPLVPDVPTYMAQDYAEGVQDVEAFTAFMQDADFGCQLIGEPGTGKGHMVKYVAQEANIPLVRVNMGMGMTRSKLVGRFVPRNGDSGISDQLERAKEFAEDEDVSVEKALEIMNIREKFEWRDGLLTAAVRNGFWILMDEINAADAELLLPLNGLLEDGEARSLEITEKAQKIEPHPGFKVVGTRNPAHHEGTKRQNHAFIDRLYDMRVKYLPPEKEAALLQDKEPIDDDQAQKLVQLANSVRNAYPEDISHMTLTFRGLQRIARRSRLFSLQQAAEQELLEGFDQYHSEGDEAAEAVKQKLGQVFSS